MQDASQHTLPSKAPPAHSAPYKMHTGKLTVRVRMRGCAQGGEFELRGGVLPACHVLRAATVNCARLFGMEVRHGSTAYDRVQCRDVPYQNNNWIGGWYGGRRDVGYGQRPALTAGCAAAPYRTLRVAHKTPLFIAMRSRPCSDCDGAYHL